MQAAAAGATQPSVQGDAMSAGAWQAEVARLQAAAEAAAKLGESAEALLCYDELLPLLAVQAGPAWADALRHVGTVHRSRGDTAQAEWWYRRSLEEAQRMGYVNGVAHATNWLAVIAVRRGEMEAAEAQFAEASRLAAETSDGRLLSMIDQNLGVLANIRGDHEGALARYQSALAACRELGDAEMLGSILNNIGVLSTELSRWTQAADAYLEAMDVACAAGLQALLNAIELNVVELDTKRQQWASAAERGRSLARLARTRQSRWTEAEALRITGMAARLQGQLDVAERELLRAAVLAADCQDRLLEAQVTRELAEVYHAAARYAEARASFAHALELFANVGAAVETRVVEQRLAELRAARR